MKANRRDFLKKAALGTAAISTGAGIKVFGAQTNNSVARRRVPVDDEVVCS